MLEKDKLHKQIEDALYNAFKNAMTKTMGMINEIAKSADSEGNIKSYTLEDMIEAFANEAKKCSDDIADSIDEYIKSAQITIGVGTILSTLPTLVSAAGPVSGKITISEPTTLIGSIK